MPILRMAFSRDRREDSLRLFAEHLKLLFRGRRVRFFDVLWDMPGLRSGGQWCGLKQNSGGHMTAASEGIDISDLIVRINFVPRRDDVTAERAEFGQGFVVMEFDVAVHRH